MKKLILPDLDSVTATIYSDASEFDLSYSDNIKEFIAEEMDIDISLLKKLDCAYFTYYKKVSNFSEMSDFTTTDIGGVFLSDSNLLLIPIDNFDLEKVKRILIHEVGHFLSLSNFSISISEACALLYERKWAQKTGRMDEFNANYKRIETYGVSLKLLDMINECAFDNDKLEIENSIKRGNDEVFSNRLDKFLQSKGCILTSKQLFFLIDILFHIRNNKEMVRCFKEKPSYFYSAFDEFHYYILPILFNKRTSPKQISDVNMRLMKYKSISDLSFEILDDIKNSHSESYYISFIKLYQQHLARQLHQCDEKEYFYGRPPMEQISSLIKDSVIHSFQETSNELADSYDETPGIVY